MVTPLLWKSRVGPSILTAFWRSILHLASPGPSKSHPMGVEVQGGPFNIDNIFAVYPGPYLSRAPPSLTPWVRKFRAAPTTLTLLFQCVFDPASPGPSKSRLMLVEVQGVQDCL